jgi:hypothetical protein
MKIKSIRMVLLSLLLSLFTIVSFASNSLNVKGIYLTQYTAMNTAYLKQLIKGAKESGIDTFVIDMEFPSKRYADNMALLKENGIKYVARITMFPGGGTSAQIKNPDVWQKKYALVKLAVDAGANAIQLDYIRYNTKQKASPENARDVMKIISWYKSKLASQNIPLQIDVFGETSFGESKYIGQSAQLFSQTVDVLCPMVYPSHYRPFQDHYKKPYETVNYSLQRIQKQFGEKSSVKVIAYIELSNYHYPSMSRAQKIDYIKAQVKAVKDANVEGWYAWSPHNRYENLFTALQAENKTQTASK